jgi:hypothetical protein
LNRRHKDFQSLLALLLAMPLDAIGVVNVCELAGNKLAIFRKSPRNATGCHLRHYAQHYAGRTCLGILHPNAIAIATIPTVRSFIASR